MYEYLEQKGISILNDAIEILALHGLRLETLET
jgi:hypothetical protein